MGNEEKILDLLEKHGKMLAEMRTVQEEMNADISQMQETLTRVAVTQEGVILPKLQLLYEGQVNLQQTLAPKERVEALEDRVITLETVIKSMSKRLAALEKAQ